MKPPPSKLDSADVIYWAWSGEKPFFIMPDGAAGIEIYGLAICRYLDSGKVYRFSCNKYWGVENDMDAETPEEAMSYVSPHYNVKKVRWEKFKR